MRKKGKKRGGEQLQTTAAIHRNDAGYSRASPDWKSLSLPFCSAHGSFFHSLSTTTISRYHRRRRVIIIREKMIKRRGASYPTPPRPAPPKLPPSPPPMPTKASGFKMELSLKYILFVSSSRFSYPGSVLLRRRVLAAGREIHRCERWFICWNFKLGFSIICHASGEMWSPKISFGKHSFFACTEKKMVTCCRGHLL